MRTSIARLEVPEEFMVQYLRMITAHDSIILTYEGKDLKREWKVPARRGQINGSGDPATKKVRNNSRIKSIYTAHFKELLDTQKPLSI